MFSSANIPFISMSYHGVNSDKALRMLGICYKINNVWQKKGQRLSLPFVV